jgi:hypothetical protein
MFTITCLSSVFELGMAAKFLFSDQLPTLCTFLDETLHEECANVDGSFRWGILSLCALSLSVLSVRTVSFGLIETMTSTQVRWIDHNLGEVEGMGQNQRAPLVNFTF